MSRPTPRHKAPARHKAPRRNAPRRNALNPVRPTIVAVTCAGLGVAGTVGIGQFLVNNVVASTGSVTAMGDLGNRTPASAGGAGAADSAAAAAAASSEDTDRTPAQGGSSDGAPDGAASDDATSHGVPSDDAPRAAAGPAQADTPLFDSVEVPGDDQPPVAKVDTFDGDYTAPEPVSGSDVLDRTAIERKRAQERADRAAARQPVGEPQEVAKTLLLERGWDETQFSCLVSLWTKESNWTHTARNPSSGAYGIPQALPASKMASAGADWETNPATQIKWGLGYIGDRYGTPCGAWSFWQANNWY